MAIELLNATDDRLHFGDLASLAGLTEVTFAFTIKPDSTPPVDLRFWGQWGATAASSDFLITTTSAASAGDIGFVITNGGSNTGVDWIGKYTNAQPLGTGIHRIVCRWKASGNVLDIWIDGSSASLTNWFTGTPASIGNGTYDVALGFESGSGTDGVDGDYSEAAIWNHYVPDWVAEAYGKGMSPRFYRNGGLLYVPAVNTGHLIDEWEGNSVTNVGGATAEHPSIIYPAPVFSGFGAAAVPPTGRITKLVGEYNGFAGFGGGMIG